jgi:hypothetical protein
MTLRTTWLERVTGEVIQEGHIRQFRLAVYPLAHGYEPRGAKTNLTVEDAEIIVAAFEARADGGPKVTAEQADKGTRWLHTTGKRLGLPERFTTEWPMHYRLTEVECVDVDDRWNEAWYMPRYTAFYPDGTTLSYRCYSWMSRLGDGSFT